MLHIGWDNLEEGFLQMHKVTSALCLLLSQVFIPVLFPPQAAHGDEPNQVRSLTSFSDFVELDQSVRTLQME